MRRALVTLFAILVCITTTATGAAERRVGLVVGNGAYAEASAALPNPPNDARAVAGALRGLGFEVIEAVDLDHGRLRATLAEFARQLEGAQAGLFFYAGHGLQIRGRNYLVPVDARLEREADAYVQALALDDVLRLMETTVPIRLVLLDACRNNPFTRSLARAAASGARGGPVVEPGLAKVEATAGTLIAYATAPDEVALDGTGPNSPFTAALVEHVGAPGLEARQVLTRVRSRVMAATNGEQVPWDSSSLTGDFYFNLTVNIEAREEREPAPAPRPAFDRDSLFWQSVQASDDPADLEAYLAQFPDGIYAALARNRLTRLRAPQQVVALPLATEAPLPPAVTAPERPPVAPAASPEAIEATLGLSREDWRRLQEALTTLGFDTRGTDGKPGPNTRKAIAAWQRGKRQEATGYLADLHRDLLLSEAEPRLAVLPPQAEPEEPEQQPAPPASPSSRAPVTECDRLAAHPDDRRRVAAGVRYEAIDPARAVPACEEAVERWPNEPRFWLQYGRALEKQGSEAAAVRWYRKAAEQGFAVAQFNLGAMYEQGRGGLAQDEAAAVRWWRKAAEQGFAAAQAGLGAMYEQGRGGLAQDEAAAVRWFKKAAEQGDAVGQYNLGVMYAQGRGGLAQDDAAVVRWWRKAAEQGSAVAQNDLGAMYEQSRGGLARDEAAAVRWYKKAAAQGHATAQFNLGVMYEQGRGGLAQDEAAAVRWYRKAAAQGDAGAQTNLGVMYEQSRGGLARDEAEAVRWYKKAAAQGNAAAQQNLARLGR
jgi:TPR repeat protein